MIEHEEILNITIESDAFSSGETTLNDYLKELLCKVWNEE